MNDELKFKIKCMYDHPEDTFYITPRNQIFKKKNCKHGTNCFNVDCKFKHIRMNEEQITEYEFFKNKYQNCSINKSFNELQNNKKRLNVDDYYPQNYKKNNTNNREDYYEINLKKIKI